MKMSKGRKYDLIIDRVDQLSDYLPELVIEGVKDDSQYDNEDDGDNLKIQLKILDSYVSYYLTGLKVFYDKGSFCILTWQDFRYFIYEWLSDKNWTVQISSATYERTIIQTFKKENDEEFKYLWLTKKCSGRRRIGIKAVRELDYLILKSNATKGVIVTTGTLTKEAKEMIEKNRFRMLYIDKEDLEREFNCI